MPDGSGLKITSEKYLTPNKTEINKVGIEPDEIVELPDSVENVLYKLVVISKLFFILGSKHL